MWPPMVNEIAFLVASDLFYDCLASASLNYGFCISISESTPFKSWVSTNKAFHNTVAILTQARLTGAL
jgi:hypothetical protein